MKKVFKFLYFFAFVVAFAACKREISNIFLEESTAPVLTASSTTIPLTYATRENTAITLNWTNPNYRFSTGVNSQDVAYVVEIDTTGANFTNPNKKAIGLSKQTSLTITQNDLNDYLLNTMNLQAGKPHNIEIRVISSIGVAAALPSNVMKYTVTPYAIPPKVTPPSSGQLYLVGDATPGGWNNPVPAPAQQFTQVSSTMYVLNSVPLVGGKSFLLLPVNGSWDTKFGAIGGDNTNNPVEDDFKQGGNNLIVPPTSGNYKFEIDFQRGRFKLTKL